MFCLQALLLVTERYFDSNEPGGHSISLLHYTQYQKANQNTFDIVKSIPIGNKTILLQEAYWTLEYVASN